MNHICNFVPAISEIEKIRATISSLTDELGKNRGNLAQLTIQAKHTDEELKQCQILNEVEKLFEAEQKYLHYEKVRSDLNKQVDKINNDLQAPPSTTSQSERETVKELEHYLHSLDLFLGKLKYGGRWLRNDLEEHEKLGLIINNREEKLKLISIIQEALSFQQELMVAAKNDFSKNLVDFLLEHRYSPTHELLLVLQYEDSRCIKFDAKMTSLILLDKEIKLVEEAIGLIRIEINKLNNDILIQAFRNYYGKSITQASINEHIAALEERIAMGQSEKEEVEKLTSNLKSQLGEEYVKLTKATEVLLTQYNKSAVLLSALSIGIGVVTAGLLFQALTLAVVIPVVVVSLAAIGMWRY